jgi:hypothetical protein
MLLQRPVLGSELLVLYFSRIFFAIFPSGTSGPSLICILIPSFVRLQNIFCEYGVPVVYFALDRTLLDHFGSGSNLESKPRIV